MVNRNPNPTKGRVVQHYGNTENRMSVVKMTITIDPDLRRKLKIHAARTDTSVSDLVRGWIREGLKAANLPPLASERPNAGPPPIPLRSKQ